MASRGILAAKQAQAAEDQAKFLALVNAKLDLLLANAGIKFDDEAFLNGEPQPSVDEAGEETEVAGGEENPPEDKGQSAGGEENPPANPDALITLGDGVKPEEFAAKLEEAAAPSGKNKK
jgi:hypothetical protein